MKGQWVSHHTFSQTRLTQKVLEAGLTSVLAHPSVPACWYTRLTQRVSCVLWALGEGALGVRERERDG